jgi:hypothetical protein
MLQVEVWKKDLQETLELNAGITALGTDHSAFLSNKTVHLPQSGTGSAIVEITEATEFPISPVKRTDSELSYNLRRFKTTPILINNLEEIQISYEKRKSVTEQSFRQLAEYKENVAIQSWAGGLPASSKVATTGEANEAGLKSITVKDIAKLAAKLDKQGMPKAGRYLVMNTDSFYELFAISEIVRASYNGFKANALEKGVVAELMGFKIIERPEVKVDGADVCFAFVSSMVSKADGANEIQSNFGDNGNGLPTMDGGELSATTMFGASRLRSDNKGVVVLTSPSAV